MLKNEQLLRPERKLSVERLFIKQNEYHLITK